MEVLGPRSSEPTRRIVDYIRRARLPLHLARSGARRGRRGGRRPWQFCLRPRFRSFACLVGKSSETHPAVSSRARSGLVWSSGRARTSTWSWSAAGRRASALRCTARRRVSRHWSWKVGCSGVRPGTSRRIENYLGFPAGVSGGRADGARNHAGAQVRRAHRDPLSRPFSPTGRRPPRHPAGGRPRDRRACGRARDRGRLPAAAGRRVSTSFEGVSVFYAAGPPEAQRCGGDPGRCRRGRELGCAGCDLARAWRRGRHAPPPARRSARDDVRLPRARSRAVRCRRARPQRDRGAARRGRRARGRHAEERRAGPVSFLFFFLGAAPCTDWLGDVVARDAKGFILTGAEAGARWFARDQRAGSSPPVMPAPGR